MLRRLLIFEVKTFLDVYNYNPTNEDFLCNERSRFISLEDSSQLNEIFNCRKFTPEHIDMIITIKYKKYILIGIDGPSGLDLWKDTYTTAVESFLEQNRAEIMYGIDPITLKIDSKENDLLSFVISGDWEPKEFFAKAVVPKKEFLVPLLDGAEQKASDRQLLVIIQYRR